MSDLDRRKKSSFLQAEGLVALPTLQSGTSVTKRFKAIAYSILSEVYQYDSDNYYTAPSDRASSLWVLYFSEYPDTIPYSEDDFGLHIKKYISSDAKLLDLIQYTARIKYFTIGQFEEMSNALVSELIGYRFLGNHYDGEATLIPVNDEQEAEANSIDYAEIGEFAGAKTHFLQAVEELKQGHFRGSVTESVSGVESVLKSISGDKNAPFGKALSTVSKNGGLHPSLKQGLEKIYGWTNSPSGMRHALSDEAIPVTEAEARFMLSACLAFAAWLKRSRVI